MLPWIYLLLSIGSLYLALTTRSVTLVVIGLLAMLGFALAGVLGLMAQRVGAVSRNTELELKRMRAQGDPRVPPAAKPTPPQVTSHPLVPPTDPQP